MQRLCFLGSQGQLVGTQLAAPVVAERTRFELAVGLPLRQFSKLLVSATHPPLQCLMLKKLSLSECKDSDFFWLGKIKCVFLLKKPKNQSIYCLNKGFAVLLLLNFQFRKDETQRKID